MKTKEISFTIPFTFLLLEWCFFHARDRKIGLSFIPLVLTLLIIPLSLSDRWTEGGLGWARQTEEISRLDYFFTQIRVIMTYIRLIFLPIQQNLDYDVPIYSSYLSLPVFLSSIVLLLLLGLALSLLFKSKFMFQTLGLSNHTARLLAFGILWFFLTLSVESSIFPIEDVMFEHRLYLPSIGLFTILSMGFVAIRESISIRVYRWHVVDCLSLILLASLALGTYLRNFVWEDAISLWSDVVAKAPNNPRGHYNLGGAYSYQGRWDEAIMAYQATIHLDNEYPRAHFHLGNSYRKVGRMAEAIREYREEIKNQPRFVMVRNNLANVLADEERYEEAIEEFQTVLFLDPGYAKAHGNLASVLHQVGRIEEAIQSYQAALAIDPDLRMARYNLGLIYQDLGRTSEAIEEYIEVLRINPDHIQTHIRLGTAYYDSGNFEMAIKQFQELIKRKPKTGSGHYYLGQIYERLGRDEDARKQYRIALTLDSNLGLARQGLSRLDQDR